MGNMVVGSGAAGRQRGDEDALRAAAQRADGLQPAGANAVVDGTPGDAEDAGGLVNRNRSAKMTVDRWQPPDAGI